MSYCRFSEGDIYMYEHVGGFVECCMCSLAPLVKTIFTEGIKPDHPFYKLYAGKDSKRLEPCEKCKGVGCKSCMMPGNLEFKKRSEALAHLQAHRDAGDTVPEYAFEGLRRDMEAEGDVIPGKIFSKKRKRWQRKPGRKKKDG